MKYSNLVNFLSVNLPLLCSSAVFRNISHEQPVDISALLKSFEVLSTWHVTHSWHIRDHIRLAMIAACVLTTGASRCRLAWRCTSCPCRRSVRSSWTSHSICTLGESIDMYLAVDIALFQCWNESFFLNESESRILFVIQNFFESESESYS